MCGIAGTVNIRLSGETEQQLLGAIRHRGPDDRGSSRIDNVWLGNTRLAIQDLSGRGHQPMQSGDGRFTLVFNGELYNHWSLREELVRKGVVFESGSDTETLLQLFIAEGAACLPRLQGIFAFAVYDRTRQELLLARDALGVKPLYYYQQDDQLAFASELKALTCLPEFNASLNPAAFYQYLLLLYSPGTATPFRECHKLLPGHFIRIRHGIAGTPEAFYTLPFNGRYKTSPEEGWVDMVDAALRKAVRAQLLSDAPVGFFLSGGLDSSLIAAMARQLEPAARLSCFTIDTRGLFAGEGFADDLPFARKAATHLNASLETVSGSFDIAASLDQMVWQLDEPLADPAAMHVYHIARHAAAQGIKVLLSGTGGDDVFSGYRRHQALYYQRLLAAAPAPLLRTAGEVLKRMGKEPVARRLSRLAAYKGDPLTRQIGMHFWSEPGQVQALFNDGLAAALPDPYAYFNNLLREIPDEHSRLNQLLYWELRTFLPDHNLNYTDKMSMAAGIETRVPYLDTNLIALACSMPPAFKMKRDQTKHILREVAKRYLPREIIYRKKTGFGAPVRQWMKSHAGGWVKERLLSGSLERWHIFNPASVEQLINDHAQGRTDGAYTLLSLLCIESWLRQFAQK